MVLGALVVMILNDHWGKQRFHNAATGKVSDVAGVFALPLVVVALVELARWARGRSAWRCRRGALAVAVAGTGLGFAATKLSAGAGAAYVVALGGLRWLALAVVAPATGGGWPKFPDVQLVADLTDLLVLPVLALTWLVGAQALRLVPTPPGTSGA